MKNNFTNLQNQFLIAMPSFNEFNFARSVIYVCAHNDDGAMGIVINRPIEGVNLGEIMTQMNITLKDGLFKDTPIFLGGPIQPERGFVVHRPNESWQSTLITSPDIAVTSSQDILEALGEGKGPAEYLVVLGYAGWGAGQLEEEIANNYWLTTPSDFHILFDTPADKRWSAAAALLGIDISTISAEPGHA